MEGINPNTGLADTAADGAQALDNPTASGGATTYGNTPEQMQIQLKASAQGVSKLQGENTELAEKNYDMHKKMVEMDPNYIAQLHKNDPDLANKLSIDVKGITAERLLEGISDNTPTADQLREEGYNKRKLEDDNATINTMVAKFMSDNSIDVDSDVAKELLRNYTLASGDGYTAPAQAGIFLQHAWHAMSDAQKKSNAAIHTLNNSTTMIPAENMNVSGDGVITQYEYDNISAKANTRDEYGRITPESREATKALRAYLQKNITIDPHTREAELKLRQ